MPEGAVAGEAERTGSSGVVEEVADQFYSAVFGGPFVGFASLSGECC